MSTTIVRLRGFDHRSHGPVACAPVHRRGSRTVLPASVRADRHTGAASQHGVVSIAKLTGVLAEYLPPEEIKEVKAAFHFSDEAHLGQYRQSGEPYITHPVAVAEICAGWKLDAQAVMPRCCMT